jgi:O-antigen ligase
VPFRAADGMIASSTPLACFISSKVRIEVVYAFQRLHLLPPAARIGAALLFVFPLFVVSIRHWASGIYIGLCVLAIYGVRKGWPPLTREERTFVAILLLYVGSAVVSNTLSGWTPASIRWSEADVRFLFAAFLFLFLRTHPHSVIWLVRGLPVAAVLVGIQAIYATFFGGGRIEGPYGPIFFGDIAALLAALSVAALRLPTYPAPVRFPLHLAGAVMGLVAVVLSGTRNAWLAAAVTLPLALFLALQGAHRRQVRRIALVASGSVLGVVAFAVLAVPGLTTERLNSALQEAASYRQVETPTDRDSVALTSVGFRLEQWRIGLAVFMERPILGHGVGNIGREINRHVEAGTASRVLYVEEAELGRPTHLHSAYFDALTYKGVVGFVLLLAVLLYPAYLAIRLRLKSPDAGALVLLHSVAFVVFSMTEDPFIRNNFTSVYLVLATSFLVLLLEEAKRRGSR